MTWKEYVAEKTYSYMSFFFFGGNAKLFNKFINKEVQSVLHEKPHEKYNKKNENQENFDEYYSLVHQTNNYFPFLPFFLLSSYFNKPDPYSTFRNTYYSYRYN